MTLEQFQWNANSRGLRVVDNVAMGDYYGQYSVFPFSISGSGKENNVFILDIRTEKVINNSLCKQLRKQLKQMGSCPRSVSERPCCSLHLPLLQKRHDGFGSLCQRILGPGTPRLRGEGLLPEPGKDPEK